MVECNPGNIEVLTDLLAEDWAKLGSVKEMGEKTQKFFREELEKTWGAKHLAVFSEEEAKSWLLGVSILKVALESVYRGRSHFIDLEFDLLLQRDPLILFQAVRLLRVSADLENRANSLRKEALQCITIALAGSDTRQFWALMTAYFGANHSGTEADDPWDFLDAAPKIPDPLPLTDTDTEDETASVQSAPATTSSFAPPVSGGSVGVGARAKVPTKGGRKPLVPQFKDELSDICSTKEAIRMYPADEGSLNITGVPAELQVERESKTSLSGASIYLCRHPKCQEQPFHAQSEAGIYSHIRRKHLGIVIACPYCERKLFWNTKGWRSHMEHNHRGAPWFGSTLRAESQEAAEMMQQVSADPLSIEKAAKHQEKRYRKSANPKRRTEIPPAGHPKIKTAIKGKIKEESDSSSIDSDHPPHATEEGTEDTSSDSDSSSSSPSSKEGDSSRSSRKKPRKGAKSTRRTTDQEPLTSVQLNLLPDIDEDMPKLEETPPPPFPKRARQDLN